MKLKTNQKQTNNKKTSNKKTVTSRRMINSFCILLLSGILIGTSVSFVLIQNVLAKPSQLSELTASNSTMILDRDGKLVDTLSGKAGGVRENVDFDQLPQSVVDAFLAIEDSRFFKHNGFDLPRFIKAGFNTVTTSNMQGGSTLTMQLIDVNTNQDGVIKQESMSEKLEQKIFEIFESMDIEDSLSKEEIFTTYVNLVNFGGPARGIQKGAQYYFGKNVENLNIGEAAFLAGVVNAPSTNNPYYGVETLADGTYFDHYESAMKRRNTTLYQMLNHGYITQSEYDLAKTTELAFQLHSPTSSETEKNKAFLDMAIEEVREKTGYDPYLVSMVITTTMDADAQAYIEEVQDSIWYPNERYQSGVSAQNNQTGEILAVGGGRNYNGERNRAYKDTHQIGSTAKPIVDYAPAFEYLGYSTEQTFEDGPVAYGDDVMYNADRQWHGELSFKDALSYSYNVPAYTTYQSVIGKIGEDKMVETLNQVGFKDLSLDNINASISVGGGALTGTPVSLSGAFSVFANSGDYIEPYCVQSIKFQNQDIDDYEANNEKQNIFSSGSAYLMSHMLNKVAASNWGNISVLSNCGYPVYGKTGTSSYEEEAENYGYPVGSAKDKWMVGYTNQFTVSAWSGYDAAKVGEKNYIDEYGLLNWNVEGNLVRKMLDHLSENGANAATIQQPADVASISHIKGYYPYASAESDSDLMVSALILKKYAGKLDTLAPEPLENPTAISISSTGKKISYNLTAYPDADKLKESTGKKTLSANGKSHTFDKIFDPSRLFGAIQYSISVKVNGRIVDEISGTKNKGSSVYSDLKNGDRVQVCGLYKYAKADVKSSEVCSSEIVVNDVQGDIEIDANFANTYSSSTSFNTTRTNIVAYMYEKYPNVHYVIKASNDPSVASGQLDPLSEIFVGAIVSSDETYTIYIGK
ncbi:MAG: transglycosylase domain-containing protein [Breznakia sp.]